MYYKLELNLPRLKFVQFLAKKGEAHDILTFWDIHVHFGCRQITFDP